MPRVSGWDKAFPELKLIKIVLTEKPGSLVKAMILSLDQLRAENDNKKIEDIVNDLHDLASKLSQHLEEPKVNGGLNHQSGGGALKRIRDDEDVEDAQENGESVKKRVRTTTDILEELILTACDRWKEWVANVGDKSNDDTENNENNDQTKPSIEDFSKLSAESMNTALCSFGKDSQGDAQASDVVRLVKIFLGLQLYLEQEKSTLNIFNDPAFCGFNDYVSTLTSTLEGLEEVSRMEPNADSSKYFGFTISFPRGPFADSQCSFVSGIGTH